MLFYGLCQSLLFKALPCLDTTLNKRVEEIRARNHCVDVMVNILLF